jgi:hypothetical protein
MKSFHPLYFLFILLSCNGNNDDKPVTKNPIKEDTGFVKPPVQNPFSPVDISPMDISYFPADYPIQKMSKHITTPPVMRVTYSRPHRQGRKIFGSLLHYGEPWRLGANEATEIELFQPVTIQNKKIPKGRYVLYCIPYQEHWTVIFNSNIHSWGLKPDMKQDLYKFDTPVAPSTLPVEYFTMTFEKLDDSNVNLLMAWDDVIVRMPIKI